MNKKIIWIIVAIVVIAGIGVGVAIVHGKSTSAVASAAQSHYGGYNGGRGGYGGMASTTGSSTGGYGRGMASMFQNIPAGMKPFFGTVTTSSTSQFIVSSSSMRTHPTNAQQGGQSSGNQTAQSSTPTETTVNIDSNTTFNGGNSSNIATGVRVAGYGNPNSDGSITAVQIDINPMPPAGMGHATSTQQ